jgi:hypothetical protein
MRFSQVLPLALAIVVCTSDPTQAEGPARFQFRRGQVLQYRVEQVSTATDSLGDLRTTVSTRVEQIKQWQVLNVEPDGTATVQLSVPRLKVQHRLPNGEVWEYDSASPDAGAEALREKFHQFVNRPLATFWIDPWGRVVEVRNLAGLPTSANAAELPFTVCLAAQNVQKGQTWSRSYRQAVTASNEARAEVELDQQFQVRSIHNGQVAIAFTTQLRDQPKDVAARLPLLQVQPQGEAIFDLQLGLVISARYVSAGVVEGHQGEASRYEFNSECRETLISQ